MAAPQTSVPIHVSLRRRALGLEYFTVAWSILEALVALVTGLRVSSIALVGFGLDSVIEAVSGAALVWRFQQRGLDEKAAESSATKLVGLTFFALTIYVLYESSTRLWHRQASEFSLPGFTLSVAAVTLMPLLGLAKRRLAGQLASQALAKDSMETFLCAYLSAALLVGLALNGWLGWWWADPVAALAMVPLMVHEGWEALVANHD